MRPPRHRAGRARENAGLSLGQAAKLLSISREDLRCIEETDAGFAGFDQRRLEVLYGVNGPWLRGEAELLDYGELRRMERDLPFGLELLPGERDAIAECTASMPRRRG